MEGLSGAAGSPQVGISSITFHIDGPVRPWERARKSGKRHFNSRDQEKYQQHIGWLCKIAMRKAGLTMLKRPVALGVRVFYPNGGRVRSGDDMWMDHTPDLDNIVKNIKDGMRGILYDDDRRVVKYLPTFKKYAAGPITTEYAVVEIEWGFHA